MPTPPRRPTTGPSSSSGSEPVARPIKRLGQHFLRDSRLLARIADALGATPDDTVIEVGPGPGGLTAALAERAGRVVALEKDAALARGLAGRWPGVMTPFSVAPALQKPPRPPNGFRPKVASSRAPKTPPRVV